MAKLNVISVLNQIAEENPTKLQMHPYYGLRDERGWMTRFPLDGGDNLISREWMEEYLEEGGSVDSAGVWGISPYAPEPGYPPVLAARLLREAHCQRWDNVPKWVVGFPYNLEISLADCEKVRRGYERKVRLESLGIHTNASLFSLANKGIVWEMRKILSSFDFTPEFIQFGKQLFKNSEYVHVGLNRYMDYSTVQIPLEQTSPAWRKFVADWERGGQNRKSGKPRRPRRRPVVIDGDGHPLASPQTLFGMKLALKKGAIGYDFLHEGGLYVYNGVCRRYTDVGTLYVSNNWILCPDSGKEIRVRRVGEFSLAKVFDNVFVWETSLGFDSHIERPIFTNEDFKTAVRAAVKKILMKREASKSREEFFQTRKISLLAFKELTGSCFQGTKNFLRENAPFIYRLLYSYSSWSSVNKELMWMTWELTPEFVEKIKHRF